MKHLYTRLPYAITTLSAALLLSACGGSGGSSPPPRPTPPPTTGTPIDVTISGKLTYDRVPLGTDNALDYDATSQEPIRFAPVQLVDNGGTVIDSTTSDANGDYSMTAESAQTLRVRVLSEVQRDGDNEIDLQVVDNTSGNSVYALQGGLVEVPRTNQTRDLNATSGWGSTSYTSTRAAAPFALLDTIYGALEGFIAVDSDVDFPAFDVYWSTRNRAESGDVADGQIGTSSFTVTNGVPVIRILGDADNDTDEYDTGVVVHEFGHYFERSLSRSDSLGGPHSGRDRLDPRVAFGEGWGNALAGMIRNDPFYRDSFGASQGQGFSINVESNTVANEGWYSEASVQSLLYDLYDGDDDGADTIELGLGPIYEAFVDDEYKETEAFTSVFAFLNSLADQSGVSAGDLTPLLNSQSINGTGEYGIGETNAANVADTLPVYLPVTIGGPAVEVCSVGTNGIYNKLGNRRWLLLEVPSSQSLTFTMTRTSGPAGADPDFRIFREGSQVRAAVSGVVDEETNTTTLDDGTYVIDTLDDRNARTDADKVDACFSFQVQ